MNRSKQPHILWQILLWWGIWLFISFILTNGIEHPQRFFQKSVGLLIGMTLIIELNIRYLLPQFYFRQRHTLFILSGITLLGLTVLLLYSSTFPWSDWLNAMPAKPEGLRPRRGPDKFSGFRWLGRLMPFIVAFMGSSLTEIARYANRKAQEAIQLEKEKLSTELKFLKSQINPHFVFNALNNIYSMAVMQAPETPESVMQLAEILRYMVYDSNEKRVPLNNEITYIENFVGLKMLKDSQGMDVTMELDKQHPQLMIPPLLFIPLVENAFKHSKIEDLKRGYIRINLSVTDNILLFYVDNSVPPNEFTKDKIGGVGLENIKQRLALIYTEDQYQLDIKPTADRFEVWLKLVVS